MKKIYQLVLLMCISTGVYAIDYRTITVTGTVSSSQIPSIATAGDSFTAVFTYNQSAEDSNTSVTDGQYYNTVGTEEGIVLTVGNKVIKSNKSVSQSFEIQVGNKTIDYITLRSMILEAPYNSNSMYMINWNWNGFNAEVLSSDALPDMANLNRANFAMDFYLSYMGAFKIDFTIATITFGTGITTGLTTPIPTDAATISETKARGSVQGEKLVLSGCSLNSKVDVYSINGVSLLSTTYSGSEIDLSRLSKGVYITRFVATNGEPTVFKILKK